MPRSLSLSVALVIAAAAAAPAQRVTADHERALSDTLRRYAQEMIATFRARAPGRAVEYYDRSGRFTHFENGNVETWATLEPKMREFMRLARRIDLRWDGEPRVLVLGRDVALISGIHEFGGIGPDGAPFRTHRGTWTGVAQRIEGRWRMVHTHSSDAPEPPGRGGDRHAHERPAGADRRDR